MTTLLDLIDVDMPGKPTALEKFEAFHEANPQVLKILEQLTGEFARKGRHIGIGMLFETLRFAFYMRTTDPNSEFKLNNNYRSFYARLIMERNPQWGQIFETRSQHAPSRLVLK